MTVPAIPVLDGHNDALLRLYRAEREGGDTFLDGGGAGHLDLPRARAGGLAGGFFAVFVPPGVAVDDDVRVGEPDLDVTITDAGYEVPLAPPIDATYARRATLAMVARLFRLEERSGGRLRVVRTVDELTAAMGGGVLAAILHLEGAEAIDPDLDALEVLYRAGLRSLGAVWSRPNVFGHGVPFRYPASPDTGPGLTTAGRDLVRACNRLGIVLDLSHLNERGFWDVAALSTAPLVATHSAAHAICPSTRNLTDRQLHAIRVSDGLVGMNFEVSALRPDGYDEPDTPLAVLVRQVDYLVARLGIERVGFGSDFDGATMPRAIGDAAGLPRLVGALRAHGYDDGALRQLAHENWLRVLRKTWRD
ncbi:MAG: Microsomal dipeptidase [uncultured Thermomicrobiales bacterium]|uniref:Microsomal dipeptidase n=1 Tax=uncultured Thermomicrobiales bacterium TaxID=1645740 RepID=A0A6J4VQZ8_9BACT|nr:MAG: Microsomal dipeptidase [uncultured Thermomicrobiales bacterium]